MINNETVFKRFLGPTDQPFSVPLEEALSVLRDNYRYLSEEQLMGCLEKGSLHSPSAVYSFNKEEIEF